MFQLKVWAAGMAACVLTVLAAPAPATPLKDPARGPEFQAAGKIGGFLMRQMDIDARKSTRVIQTVIRVRGSTEPLEAAIAAGGGRLEAVSGRLLQARLTVSQIQRLAKHESVLAMRVPYYAEAFGFASAGVAASGAEILHRKGITGAGAQVVVLDVGFDGYRGLAGIDLPADVQVKNFNSNGFATSRHGTAVAEIVHDMAPAADLTLVAVGTDVEYMAALDWIAQQPGIDVVNASIGFDNVGPLDGTSPITEAADQFVEESGILYVNAAGNEQQDYYSARYSDPDGDGWHNFSAGDEQLAVQFAGGDPYNIVLNWNDWGPNPAQPASNRDYDIYLWCPGISTFTAETACASSTVPQTGAAFDRPLERISRTAPKGGEYLIGIRRKSGGLNLLRLSITGLAANGTPEYVTRHSTLTLPADGQSVLAVGAFNITDYGRDLNKLARPTDQGYSINDWRLELPPEPYSSLGPTWDGRVKPELSAPDCVFTASFGNAGFCGTSAAAPYVAGAAALLESAEPARDAAALRRILISTAEDVRPEGVDNAHGAGRLSLEAVALKPGLDARSGLWGDPAQNGHGFYFDIRSGRMAVLWYTYDKEGTPVWLLAAGALQNGRFSAAFNSYRAPKNVSSPLAQYFDGAGSTVKPQPIGTITVTFTGAASADIAMHFSGDNLVAAADYQLTVQQFLIYPAAADSGLAYASPYTGLWYNAAQNGHGFYILRQGFLPSPNLNRYPSDRVVISWFGYDTEGEPLWLQGNGLMDDTQSYFKAGTSSSGHTLFRYSGPTVTGDFGLAQMFGHTTGAVRPIQTGSFSLKFDSASRGTISFSSGEAINETLPLERLEF